ncbi:ring-cleaving dioxygenase [Haloarcula nitratireducens]|uniref:Ring-cleaving dioxygenase n=1 Tax=Haloarcula nitratireducens TaxID=2487749 RepID=A0AAW4P9X6_9EURY|nr:ring-cleaving dioxygenase [Halomicroarcula nitratireducens]MBX0294558.1 ring-cleaving dioxygenase [Halomicroarcula nitratireducens]
MAPDIPGLHHVTAIAGDPQRNADFYVGTLGLRFVKRTVNHDDTGTYHFYFGDGEGTPGTNITFFPWTNQGREGRFGAGQTQDTAYLVPEDSVEYWTERLDSHGVAVERTERFGETVLQFEDPDGIGLELVAADAETDAVSWVDSPVPEEHQLRGFHSVTLAVPSVEPTAGLLTEMFGYAHEATEGDRHRYRSAAGGFGSVVDLVETDDDYGQMGVGTVHHVAFRADDVEALEAFRDEYLERGLRPSEVIDRVYFHALYAREPNGILFEISTMEPGFTADESLDELGSSLALPGWVEDERKTIERQLPDFDGPTIPDGSESAE